MIASIRPNPFQKIHHWASEAGLFLVCQPQLVIQKLFKVFAQKTTEIHHEPLEGPASVLNDKYLCGKVVSYLDAETTNSFASACSALNAGRKQGFLEMISDVVRDPEIKGLLSKFGYTCPEELTEENVLKEAMLLSQCLQRSAKVFETCRGYSQKVNGPSKNAIFNKKVLLCWLKTIYNGRSHREYTSLLSDEHFS